MAITEGTKLRVSLVGAWYDQLVMNVWTYQVGGTFSGISAGAVAEAWWNHVKDEYRAMVASGYGNAFERVIVADMDNPAGDYGDFSIPTAERVGTRSAGSAQGMPPYAAAGVRLSVATRVTRPGQKRFGWLLETDAAGPGLDPVFAGLVADVMDAATVGVTLGAPALGMDLDPIVVRLDPVTGLPVAAQSVTGYAINTNTTSQVSRKIGKGR